MRVPLRFFMGRPLLSPPKKENDRELPDAVARRSWVLRGVTYVGVAEEARTRGFVPPALAGFAFLAAGVACSEREIRRRPWGVKCLLWLSPQQIFPSPHDDFPQDSVDGPALGGACAGAGRRVLRGRQNRTALRHDRALHPPGVATHGPRRGRA